MSHGTRVSNQDRVPAFAYGTSTLYGSSFQNDLANRNFCNCPTLTALRSDWTPTTPAVQRMLTYIRLGLG